MSATPAPQIRLLGDPALIVADGSIKALERRAAGLLALVALEPGVTRARAAALLWPESDNARQALRQQIARFRKHYGAQLVEGEDALTLSAGVQVDALLRPDGDLLGPLSFDDCADFAAWLQQVRERRRGGQTASLTQQLAAAEAAGDLDGALHLATQLLQADPDSEAPHRSLMRLHYLRGDVAQAQATYERLVRQLNARFGAQPSPETEALARALRTALATPQQGAPTARTVPVTVLRPPRMIGRQRELTLLGDAWSAGQASLLLGEPGLGKSRLLAEFAAARNVVLVQGRPGDAGVPYATLARLLRAVMERSPVELPAPRRSELARLLPELAPAVPLPSDGQRLLLQSAIEAMLAQAQVGGPRLDGVVVDDLHFADEASVEMLQALLAAEALRGLRWALAQRPGEGPAAAAALRAAMEEGQSLVAIDVQPLTVAEVRELIESLGLPGVDALQLAEPLTRHTGGNPLFILETLKQGLASGAWRDGRLPMPVAVGALIERRLKQLSERALALARVAAIAGTDFSIPLAEEITGARAVELADAWAELEAAQVLRDQAFAHDLVYDAVLRSVPDAIARHLHAQLARWLQDRGGETARIAAHWEAAQEAEAAAQAWVEAARVADARLRHREAMQCYERAAGHFAVLGDDAARYASLRGALDEASLIHVDGATYARMVDRLIEAAPDAGARAEALVYRLRVLEQTGEHAATLKLADQVQALARAAGQPTTEAMALTGRAGALYGLGQLQEAAELYQQVSGFGARVGNPELEGFGYSARATVLLRLCRHAEAMASFEQARALYERSEMSVRLVLVDQQISILHSSRGYAAAGLAAAERALHGALQLEIALDLMGNCVLAQSLALRALGRYAQAIEAVDRCLQQLIAADIWAQARLQVELAQIYVELGRPDLARRLATQVREGGRLPQGEMPRLVALDLQARVGADRQPALALVADARIEARRRCELLRLLAPSAAQPQALLDQALRAATEGDLPHELATARALLARELARAGQTGAAAELMRVALADPDLVPAGYPPGVAECAVEVFTAAGDVSLAQRALAEAIAWIHRAGQGLPAEFRTSFVQRNEVNRRLLALADRAAP
jgi:DNA-binding SARP family transcriptional activator/tetratricopeptide (TPR) repeat protein